MKRFLVAIWVVVCVSALATAQQSPSPAPAQSNQITPQVLGEMLRSATTFHELVRDLNKNLGPDVHTGGPDGVPQHSIARTAATMGAGAGVGAAIGGFTRNQNGVLIGALIGGVGGLILDEILKHREETHPKPVYSPVPDASPFPVR